MVTIAAGHLGAGQRAGSPSTSSPEGQCHVFTFLSPDLAFTIHPWTKCDKNILQVWLSKHVSPGHQSFASEV